MPMTGVSVRAFRLIALAATVALLGCGTASERDLIGTWQITDESREHLPEELRDARGLLTLAEDGTFTAWELPVSVPRPTSSPSPADEEPALLTGGGDWKLSDLGGPNVRLSIDTATDDYPGELPYDSILSIYAGVRGYRLVDHWGDPDAMRGIFLTRTE